MVRREVLPNGLTLLVREMRTAPVVALNLWVAAGSADDPEGLGGIAHFTEHMMFRGDDGGSFVDLAHVVQGAGGYLNAQTGCDHTLYYQVVPSARWTEVLEAQSVAVGSPVFDRDEVERERAVIVEEARSGENDPGTFAWRRLMETSFVRHPCRRPVVGTEESLSRVTVSDLERFHRERYAPGNLIEVVVGDVDPDEVVARARELLGRIPARDGAPPVTAEEPLQDCLRATSFAGRLEQSYLAIAFHTPSVLHPDIPVLDALCGLLGIGRSSRLRKSLQVGKGLVSDVSAFVAAHRDVGILSVRAIVPEGVPVDRVVEETFSEIEALRSAPAGSAEMEKNITRLEAGYVLEHETADAIAHSIGLFQTFGDYRYASEYVDRLAAVTADDVLRVAREYLRPERATVVSYHPEDAGSPVGDRAEHVSALLGRVSAAAGPVVREEGRPFRAASGFTRPTILMERASFDCRRGELSNGASLVVCQSPALPITSIALGFRGGFTSEPDDTLGITYLMQKLVVRGTRSRTADELADDTEGLGTSIATSVDRDGFGLGFTVLSKHFGRACSILAEVVTEPALPEEQLDRVRKEIVAEIGEIEDRPLRRALRLLLPLIFPGHPYGRPLRGEPETLGSITRDAVVDWRRRGYAAEELVVCVAGDLPESAVRNELEDAFSGMGRTGSPAVGAGPASRPVGRVEERAPGKGQSTVVLGFPGPAVGDADSVVVRFLGRAISMMGGRLWQALRERPPNAYVVGASPLLLRTGGSFIAYATAPPGQEEVAVEAFLSEFRGLRERGRAEEELARAKRCFAGTLEIAMQRGAARAASYAMAEVLGVGYEHVLRMPEAVRRISNDDVIEVARRHLDDRRGIAAVILRAE